MGNYEQLKQSVSDVIKTNGNQEITGSILQNVLLTIISSVGANATFAGVATPTTNPGTPDGPVFWIAAQEGVYSNFNAIELQDGLSVLMWNGSWSGQQIFSIDDEPTAESDNLVKSSGVYAKIKALEDAGYVFAGVATPETNPGTPNHNIFYIASEAGTYTNFNAIELQAGLSVLMWNGTWSSQQVFGIDDVPTAGSDNLVKSGGVAEELALGAVYDVSAKNPTAGPNNDGKFESLPALLRDTNLNTLIPTSVRKGGMSIKFVQSSDNKYVKLFCTAQNFTTDVTQWQGVDETPTAGSQNLVKSGGVQEELALGAVYDVSAKNPTAGVNNDGKWKSLSALLSDSNLNTLIPTPVRKGGMSIKFVQSSGNKYVHFFCLADDFTTDTTQWQGVDETPTAESQNLVKSGGAYENDNYLAQLIESQEVSEKTFDFPRKGYIKTDGRFQPSIYGHCTNRIYLFDNLLKIHYKGYLVSTGFVVAFFNGNDEILTSLSITGNESTLQGVITIDSTYSEAKYFIISHYGGITGALATVEYKNITKELLYDNIAITEKKFSLLNHFLIKLNGERDDTNFGRSTNLLIVKDLPRKIDYSLALEETYYIVAFFDENQQILSEISITGDSSVSIQTGTIDLSEDAYNNAVYVVFSTYTGLLSTSYVKEDNTEQVEEISKIARNASASIIKDINNNLEPEVKYTFDNAGCILYNNGNVYGSGGYRTNNIPLSPYTTNIFVRQSSLDDSGAVIAFYDKDDNYLKDISVSGAAGTTISLDITDEILNKAAYFIASTYIKTSVTYCLVTSLNTPRSFLYGKHFCALGDSITDGDGNHSYSWYDMLLKRYNATVGSLNYGISGSCLRAMADFCTAENMANIDICFVMGGTNQLRNYKLGTINDDPTPDKWKKNTAYAVGDRVTGGTRQTSGTTNWSYLYWYECIGAGTSGNTDYADGFPTTTDETFTDGTVTWKCIGNPSWYSDMKRICTKVWGYNPKIQIIWMIPIKQKSDVGKTPEQYAHAEKFNAIRNFCEYNSIRMIDLQKEFPLNEYTQNAIMADTLHPNEAGYKIIQDIVCSHIE